MEEGQAQTSDSDLAASVSSEPAVETPKQQQLIFPDGGARAWSVAFSALGVLFSTLGYANAFGVFQEYYETHQLRNESPSTISWIGSLQIFFLFGGTMFGGPLFDRYGAKVVWPSATLYILSVMMTSLCEQYYQFLLAQGVLGGLSMGMVMAPAMAATSQYFSKKRGTAMGIAVSGSSLGGVIFPIALSKMVNNPKLGFGTSVRILGFIMLALLALSCTAIRARLPPRKGRFFLASAFKNIQFLGLLVSTFLMVLGVYMPIFYLPTFAVSHGMSTQLASHVVSILNGASFFGRVIPGVLGDKLGQLNALSGASLGSGILLFCMPKTSSNAAIIIFAALYGFTSGAIISGMTVVFTQVPKEATDIGTYLSIGMGVVSIAALIGPPIEGAFVSHYHGFSEVSIFSGVVVLVGGFTTILVKGTTAQGIFGKI